MSQTPPSSDVKEAVQRRRWLRGLRDIALLVLLVGLVQWWQSRDLAGDLAPPLSGSTLAGARWRLDPAQGPWLVHFWAEWCPVCRLEQGSIAALAAAYPVITVATNSGTAAEVAAYLRDQGVDLPVVLDTDGAIAGRWGVSGVPASFIVGTDGRIHSATMGYTTGIGLRLRLWLAD